MKKGGHTKNHSGFTIVETLIVLAVTGGLFLVAALYIGGKQAKTEFQVGVRDVQTRLQQVVNETASGYYPSSPVITCTLVPPWGDNLRITNSGGAEQGERDKCIFMGKVMVINDDTLYVYSLAGARQKDNEDVTNMVDARATVIAKSDINKGISNAPDVYKLPYGFELVRASQNGASPVPATVYGVAILSSLANFSDSTGSQQFGLGAISGSFTVPINQVTIADVINNEVGAGTPYNPLKQVDFCIHNGGDKSALIIVGGDGSLTVRTEIKNGLSCGV